MTLELFVSTKMFSNNNSANGEEIMNTPQTPVLQVPNERTVVPAPLQVIPEDDYSNAYLAQLPEVYPEIDYAAEILSHVKSISKPVRADNNERNRLSIITQRKNFGFYRSRILPRLAFRSLPRMGENLCSDCKHVTAYGYDEVTKKKVGEDRIAECSAAIKEADYKKDEEAQKKLANFLRITRLCEGHKFLKEHNLTKPPRFTLSSNVTSRSMAWQALNNVQQKATRGDIQQTMYTKLLTGGFKNVEEHAEYLSYYASLPFPRNTKNDVLAAYFVLNYPTKRIYCTLAAASHILNIIRNGLSILQDIDTYLVHESQFPNVMIMYYVGEDYSLDHQLNISSLDDELMKKINAGKHKHYLESPIRGEHYDVQSKPTYDEMFPLRDLHEVVAEARIQAANNKPSTRALQTRETQSSKKSKSGSKISQPPAQAPAAEKFVKNKNNISGVSKYRFNGIFEIIVRQAGEAGQTKVFQIGLDGPWNLKAEHAQMHPILDFVNRPKNLGNPKIVKSNADFLLNLMRKPTTKKIEKPAVYSLGQNRFAPLKVMNLLAGGKKKVDMLVEVTKGKFEIRPQDSRAEAWKVIVIPGDGNCFFNSLGMWGLSNDRNYWKAKIDALKDEVPEWRTWEIDEDIDMKPNAFVEVFVWTKLINAVLEKEGNPARIHILCHTSERRFYYGDSKTNLHAVWLSYDMVNQAHVDVIYNAAKVSFLPFANREYTMDVKALKVLNSQEEILYLGNHECAQREIQMEIDDISKHCKVVFCNRQLTLRFEKEATWDEKVEIQKLWVECQNKKEFTAKGINFKAYIMNVAKDGKDLIPNTENVKVAGKEQDLEETHDKFEEAKKAKKKIESVVAQLINLPLSLAGKFHASKDENEGATELTDFANPEQGQASVVADASGAPATDSQKEESSDDGTAEEFVGELILTEVKLSEDQKKEESTESSEELTYEDFKAKMLEDSEFYLPPVSNGIEMFEKVIKDPSFSKHTYSTIFKLFSHVEMDRKMASYIISEKIGTEVEYVDCNPINGPLANVPLSTSVGTISGGPPSTNGKRYQSSNKLPWQKVYRSTASKYLNKLSEVVSGVLPDINVIQDLFISFKSAIETTYIETFQIHLPTNAALMGELTRLLNDLNNGVDARTLSSLLSTVKANKIEAVMEIKHYNVVPDHLYRKQVNDYLYDARHGGGFNASFVSNEWWIHEKILNTLAKVLPENQALDTGILTVMLFLHKYIYPCIYCEIQFIDFSLRVMFELINVPSLRNVLRNTDEFSAIRQKIQNHVTQYSQVYMLSVEDGAKDLYANNLVAVAVYYKHLKLANVLRDDSVTRDVDHGSNAAFFKCRAGGVKMRRVGFGIRMGDPAARHLNLETRTLEVLKARDTLKSPDRTPIFVELPGSTGYHLPHLDNDADTLWIGLQNRVAKFKKEYPSQFIHLMLGMSDWFFDNGLMTPLDPDNYYDFEPWLAQLKGYTIAEKEVIRRAWYELCDKYKFQKNINVFCKFESYDEIKVARGIFSATNHIKAFFGPLIASIERHFFAASDQHVQGLTSREKLEKIMDLDFNELIHKVMSTDWKKFESHFTQGLLMCENYLMYKFCSLMPETYEILAVAFEQVNLRQYQNCSFDHLMLMVAKRVSGIPWTLCFNTILNMMVFYCAMFTVFWKLRGEDWRNRTHPDDITVYMSEMGLWIKRAIFCGDDGLIIVPAEYAPHFKWAYAQFGIDIDSSVFDKIHHASFCGVVASSEGAFFKDAISTILKFGRTSVKYLWSKDDKLVELARIKAECLLHDLINCPVVAAYCNYILRVLPPSNPRRRSEVIRSLRAEMSTWEFAQLEIKLEGKGIERREIGQLTRHEYEQIYGISVLQQIVMESYWNNAKTIVPPPQDFLDLLSVDVKAYTARYVFQEPLLRGCLGETFVDTTHRFRLLDKDAESWFSFKLHNDDLLNERVVVHEPSSV